MFNDSLFIDAGNDILQLLDELCRGIYLICTIDYLIKEGLPSLFSCLCGISTANILFSFLS